MRWRWRRPNGRPSLDAQASAEQARRALTDATNLAGRLEDVTERLAQTRERNHFAAAVARAIRGN